MIIIRHSPYSKQHLNWKFWLIEILDNRKSTQLSSTLRVDIEKTKSFVILDNPYTLWSQITDLYIRFKLTRAAGNEILRIFRNASSEEIQNLHSDIRTVVNAAKYQKNFIVQQVCAGTYHYFGIQNILNKNPSAFFDETLKILKLSINIDGLLITESSSKNFWPILGKINKKVFMIAIFFGDGKPSSANIFMLDFSQR